MTPSIQTICPHCRRCTDRLRPGDPCPNCATQVVERTNCGCGHPIADCAPEICSHSFARAALWGD